MIDLKNVFCRLANVFALPAGLAGAVLSFATASHAQDVYTFKSVLSTPSASWCITVPANDQNTHLIVAGCDGQPHQAFAYDNNSALTAGGYCVGGVSGKANQPPSAGDPVAMTDCSGSDDQAWELQPFKDQPDVFAIANPDSLCVTVENTPIQPNTALVLAQCAELPTQGWVRSKSPPSRVKRNSIGTEVTAIAGTTPDGTAAAGTGVVKTYIAASAGAGRSAGTGGITTVIRGTCIRSRITRTITARMITACTITVRTITAMYRSRHIFKYMEMSIITQRRTAATHTITDRG